MTTDITQQTSDALGNLDAELDSLGAHAAEAATTAAPADATRAAAMPSAGTRGDTNPRPRVRIGQVPAHAAPAIDQATVGSAAAAAVPPPRETIFDVRDLSVSYGSNPALAGVTMQIQRNLITAMIGPSGCGKSTFLRSLNRMNDSVRGFSLGGQILYHGHDVYGPNVDPVEVRRRIGMVFQRPNPFPKSIYDNIAWAPRNLKMKSDLDRRVEYALRGAALWDEVKDRLHSSALGLSGGQQQRLCIARAIACEPAVLLMDEPCAALDPIATRKIELLMQELKKRFTIVIVTHNLQQAQRLADKTGFFYVDTTQGDRTGYLVEFGETKQIFEDPREKRTQEYIRGEFS